MNTNEVEMTLGELIERLGDCVAVRQIENLRHNTKRLNWIIARFQNSKWRDLPAGLQCLKPEDEKYFGRTDFLDGIDRELTQEETSKTK